MPAVRVQGIAELRRALQAISKEAPKELAKTNKAAGQIVVAEAQRRAPKGPHQGGGSVIPLAHSIVAVSSQTRVTIRAGGKKTPYAAAIEFGGTIPRRGFKGRKAYAQKLSAYARHSGTGSQSVTRVTARPFLIPAVEAKLADVVIAYERMLDALIARFRSTS